MLHRSATISREMTMNSVDEASRILDERICILSGDSRRKSKAAEHLVSHMPTMYNRSLT